MRLRSLLAMLVMAVAMAGCDSSAPKFNNADITGAEYARDFALTDHNGKPRTLADFRGKVVTVFFGFTHCPDVCPTTLSEMKLVLKELGSDANRVQVLFVTVDPERDTPEVLRQYVPSFDPGFLGLYGDAKATAEVARNFKVFYQKVPGAKPDTYTVDHTAASYVFDPQGRLRLFVRHGTLQPLVSDLRLLLQGK
jgi:protein SCO1/2